MKSDFPEGGMVPKSLYRTAEELECEENRLLTDSIYKSASIFKGAPYEVVSASQSVYNSKYLFSNEEPKMFWSLRIGMQCHLLAKNMMNDPSSDFVFSNICIHSCLDAG